MLNRIQIAQGYLPEQGRTGSHGVMTMTRDVLSHLEHTTLRVTEYESPRAGRFRWWYTPRQVLDAFKSSSTTPERGLLMDTLLHDVVERIEAAECHAHASSQGVARPEGIWTLHVQCPTYIGWEDKVSLGVLPVQTPTEQVRGTTYVAHDAHLLASYTRQLTIRYSIEYIVGYGWEIVINDMYPGNPLPHNGNDARDKYAFFFVDHPGRHPAMHSNRARVSQQNVQHKNWPPRHVDTHMQDHHNPYGSYGK